MDIKSSAAIAGLIVLATLSGCASQHGSGSGSNDAVSASSPKCEVDAKRVCQEMRQAPVVDSATGQTQDQTERQQNSNRTDTRIFSFQVPNGSMIQVQCEINNQHNTVVYAHAMSGPPLTPTDISALESSGYCVH
jgi:hypothetical protein